jgi:hypothetical protein
MLQRGGYTTWAMVMEVNLQAASLWEAIEEDHVARVDDMKTLAALLRSTPEDMHCMLIGKGSAKAAWEAIRVQYQGPDRVRDGRVRRLRTEFETVAFKNGEKIQDFALRISNLAAALRSLGDTIGEEKIVRKFLSVVPRQFLQIAFSMETLLDPATLTVEEVTGHLRAIEERLDGDQGSSAAGGAQLLLTEEQWEAKKRQSRGGGHGQGKKGDARKGSTPPKPNLGAHADGKDIDREHCHYCGKKGHWARECRKKQRDEAAAASANLVQAEQEEDGPAMMMAIVEEVLEHAEEGAITALTAAQPLEITTCTGGQVFLNEERAIVTPSHVDDHGTETWFLDTGATNHMTGSSEAFADLDRSVTGKVRFADGSVVGIRGRGTVVFAVEGGDHRAFTEVFYIPALKSSGEPRPARRELVRHSHPPRDTHRA